MPAQTGDLAVIVKAKDLCGYVMTATPLSLAPLDGYKVFFDATYAT